MKNPFSIQNLPQILTGFILILLIFVPRTADLGLFLSHDEAMRNRQSLDSFEAIAEGRWGDVYSSNFGAANLTWARTGFKLLHYAWLRAQGVEVALADMVNYGPKFDPLPGAIFNALLVIIAYWFIRQLFEVRVALVATAILALDPYLLAEARVLRTEAAFAVCMLLSLVSLAAYARTYQRRYLLWAGFWAAWTIATKISGVMLLAMVGPVLLVAAWNIHSAEPTLSRRAKRFGLDLLLWSGVAVVVTFIIWPTLWVKPVETFTELYDFVMEWGLTPRQLDFFFLGQTVRILPVSYYVLVLLYKTTPLVWLGLQAFGWLLWQSRSQRTNPPNEAKWLGWTFPAAGGLIVLLCAAVYFAAMSRGTFKTERYMMAAVALLDIVAAVGLVALGEWVYRRWVKTQPAKPVFWAAAILMFFVGHGLFTWLNHPYYFSYYNPLLGGGWTAVKTVEVGSGELIDLALDYLARQPNPEKQVVVCGTNLPRCEYRSAGQTWLERDALNPLYGNWITAAYVVTYIFQIQRGDYPPGVIEYLEKHPGPVYTARFQGIDYAKVYPAPKAQHLVASELIGISTLLGYNLSQATVAAGEPLHFKFYWQNDGRIDYDMFVQLVDSDEYVWSETVASFLPGFENLRHQRGAIVEGEAELFTPVGMPPGIYTLKMGYKTGNGQLVGLFELPAEADDIEVVLPEHFTPAPVPTYSLRLRIDPTLTILGYNLNPVETTAGAPVWLTLFWQADQNVANDYVVNLRLLDATGQEMMYWLGRPVRSGYPTQQWQAGQIIQDPWQLIMPADLPPGLYKLQAVIFDTATTQPVQQADLQMVTIRHGSN